MGPSWGRLGALLGPLGALLGSLGAVLRPLGAVLGFLGALLEPSWGHLGRLKAQSGEVSKTYKHIVFLMFWAFQGLQDGPKLGQVWVKLRS